MLFESAAFDRHELISAARDDAAGLNCIIALHSTSRGPGAGGCRMLPYASAGAALDDCLRLSRAMSLKCAIADLELGGAWSVIIGDGRATKTPVLLHAYGRIVDSFQGRFWSIVDVGTDKADMAEVRTQSQFVTGVSGHPASAGDPSPSTALGVFLCMELCVRRRLGHSLSGVRVAVQGVGQVGAALAHRLSRAGAELVIADVDCERARAVAARTDAKIVAPDEIMLQEVDVFSPCALGGSLSADSIHRLRAEIVVGGANNQVAEPALDETLRERGILYAPDYVANAGGIIAIAAEIRAVQRRESFDPAWVEHRIHRLVATLDEILGRAVSEDRPASQVADELALARLES